VYIFFHFLLQDIAVADTDTETDEPLDRSTVDGINESALQSTSATSLAVQSTSCVVSASQPTSNSGLASHTVPTVNQWSKRCKKSAAQREEDNVLKTIAETMKQRMQQSKRAEAPDKLDPYDVFGTHVANELRCISDPYTVDYVKNQISQLLFEAKWGRLPVSGLMQRAGINNQQNPVFQGWANPTHPNPGSQAWGNVERHPFTRQQSITSLLWPEEPPVANDGQPQWYTQLQ